MTASRPPRGFEPDDLFFRAIPQEFVDLKRKRISPGAFSNTTRTEEMSVDWAFLSTASESMARWAKPVAIGQFVKRICDDLQQQCVYQPLPENPAHCAVIGRKPNSVAKQFARAAQFVIWTDDWAIPEELRAR